YNMRVVECKLAAMILAISLGGEKSRVLSDIKILKDVEPAIAERFGGGTEKGAEAVKAHLHEGRYTLEEIEGILGTSLQKLFEGNAMSLKVLEAGREDGGFLLQNRALHVFEEAQRVRQFKAICDTSSSCAEGSDDKLRALGSFMDDSHASCSNLFECSCPELNQLVEAAKSSGALGARLTGAGWGGCCVFLVQESHAEPFMSALKDTYYAPRMKAGLLQVDLDNMGHVLFASKPSAGAAVLQVPDLLGSAP
ncbi:hypothetical protein CEUSTIGMA_g7992.t1, partial [Chlamydomonas eustigma]